MVTDCQIGRVNSAKLLHIFLFSINITTTELLSLNRNNADTDNADSSNDLYVSFHLYLLVEFLQPNHENCLPRLNVFQLGPVRLGRAVFVGLGLEVTDESDDDLVHDGPGLLLLDDLVQAFQVVSQRERKFFQPKNKPNLFFLEINH